MMKPVWSDGEHPLLRMDEEYPRFHVLDRSGVWHSVVCTSDLHAALIVAKHLEPEDNRAMNRIYTWILRNGDIRLVDETSRWVGYEGTVHAPQ